MKGIREISSEDQEEFAEAFNKLNIEMIPDLGQLLISGEKEDIQEQFANLDIEDINKIMGKLVELNVVDFDIDD